MNERVDSLEKIPNSLQTITDLTGTVVKLSIPPEELATTGIITDISNWFCSIL